MATIDLTELTRDEVRSLIGYRRGERAREHFRLDVLDSANGFVEVRAPANLRTLTPSFVQGLFADSIIRLGEAGFRQHYRLVGFSESATRSVDAGINRVLMRRFFDTSRSQDGLEVA